MDTGDHVIVINAAKIRITGLKADSKVYYNYSGYPGGMRAEEYKKRLARKPERVVEEAITGMLPHTKLGRAMAGKLKVYRDDKHPHSAQKPEAISPVFAKRASVRSRTLARLGLNPGTAESRSSTAGNSNPLRSR